VQRLEGPTEKGCLRTESFSLQMLFAGSTYPTEEDIRSHQDRESQIKRRLKRPSRGLLNKRGVEEDSFVPKT